MNEFQYDDNMMLVGIEVTPEDSYSDDGTMQRSAEELQKAVVGHRIINAERKFIVYRHSPYGREKESRGTHMVLTLDNQTEVILIEQGDCCAYTSIDAYKLMSTEHVITSVGTTNGFQKWFIYGSLGLGFSGDKVIFGMDVDWSCGNPFYYGYGFEIIVQPITIVMDAKPEPKGITKMPFFLTEGNNV